MIKINGQPSLFLLDLKGKEHPAIAEVNRKKRVNGQREISLSFLYDEINQNFIHDVEFGWKILFKGEWYTITSPTYALDGDVFSVGVDAILSFFVDMNGHYLQDEVEDKSSTPMAYFTDLFKGTGYNFTLVGNFSANTLNYQANQSKTERFLYGVDRFKGEYVIRGKVAYIHELIGSDKDVILHEDLNIQDVSIEVDASGFHTWAKGFGDKDDMEEDADYKLEVEYVSPLVNKHGYIEGPAIRDGSYKHKDALTESVKKQVENSAKISTTITAVDLTNNGYPEMQFEEGDRVWLYVDRLKLNTQVRVVEIDETFDWEGNIIDVQYTVGNEGIAARYKTQQYDTLKDFQDITSGRKTLDFNWFPEMVKRASDIINGNLDSHFHYGAGEIIGINKSNPNGYMRFNTDGIGFSRDGGKTYGQAMTYEGVVAESIVGQSIIGVNLASVNERGFFHVTGSDAEFYDTTNNRKVSISPSGLYGYNAGGDIRFQADSTLVTSSAFGTSNANVYLGAMPNGEARVVNYKDIPGDGLVGSYRYLAMRASGFYGNYVNVNPAVSGGATNLYLRPLSGGEVRVTLSTSTTNYQNFRADGIYGNYLDINTLQSGRSDNLYIRPADGGEVRVTRSGSTTSYRPVRAAGFYGDYFDVNAADGGENVYVRPTGSGRLKVTQVGTTDNFKPVEAEVFLKHSDTASLQGHFSLMSFRPKENEATSIIKDLDLIRHTSSGLPVFNLVNDSAVSSDDGQATDINKALMYALRSLQETDKRLNKLEGVA